MSKIQLVDFDTNGWVTTTAKEFPPDRYCNGFLILNSGVAPSIVVANGVRIPAGSSITIGGNVGERFRGRLQIAFEGAGTPECSILQKFYTNPKQLQE